MSKVKIYNGVTINMSTSKVIKEGEVRYINSSDVSYCGMKGGAVNQSGQQPIAALPTIGQGVGNRGGLNYGGPAVAPPSTGGYQTLGPGSMGQPPMNIAPPAPGTYGPGSMQPQPALPPNIAPPAPGMGGGIGTVSPGTYGPGSFKDVPLGDNSGRVQHMGPGSMGPPPGIQGPQTRPAVQPPMNIAPPAPGMGGGFFGNPATPIGTSVATGTPQGVTNGK